MLDGMQQRDEGIKEKGCACKGRDLVRKIKHFRSYAVYMKARPFFFYKSEMPNYVLGLQVVELVSRTNP
jgi:hypothetical protein